IGQLTHLPRAEAVSRGAKLLERFELSDAGGRPVKTYSGGMRRRLDLAAALVHRPQVLFLDEPTTGLDPYSRMALWGVIEELVSDGTTVLLTTQYLEEADRLAKRLAVVDHGHVIAEGTSAELKASLGASVLDLEMGDTELAERALDALGGRLQHLPTARGSIVEIPLDEGTRMAMSVLGVLDDLDLMPKSFAVREPSLDDVFLKLTGHVATEEDSETTDPGGRERDGASSGDVTGQDEPGSQLASSGGRRTER
ncbi:MAG: ATP-binding cassette domain-containing protein, partial [Acidimicrobiales bacterium]